MDKKVFKEGMAILCEQFEKEPSELFLKGYWLVLKDFSNEQFEKAIATILETYKYAKIPPPATIREAICGVKEDKAVLAIARIEKAWSDGVDIHKNVNFGDPVLHETINQAGGWVSICNMLEHDWRFLRKELEKKYALIMDIPSVWHDAPEILWGLHGSIENREMLTARGVVPQIADLSNEEIKYLDLEKYLENSDCQMIDKKANKLIGLALKKEA